MTSGFLDDYLPYLLRRADQTLSQPFYNVLADSDVGRSEWRVLAVLEELGEMTVAELTANALSPQPTVTHAVKRLEERGLVTRTPGEHDKRQRIIAITTDGSILTQSLLTQARELEAAALEQLGDLTDLIDQLRVITTAVEAQTSPADSPPVSNSPVSKAS